MTLGAATSEKGQGRGSEVDIVCRDCSLLMALSFSMVAYHLLSAVIWPEVRGGGYFLAKQ